MKTLERSEDEKLMYVSTAEEYAFRHNIEMADVLSLFKKNRISEAISANYGVLHMLDISDTVSMVEKLLERSSV